MKRMLLILGLVLVLMIAMSATVLAAGYNAQTGGKYTSNPHGDYTATSNKCKTCHAVHQAGETGYLGGGAWKLLRASSANDACDYCHIISGAHSNAVVYDQSGAAPIASTNGHTIGDLGTIPDGTADIGALTCNKCHTVHGAGAITFAGSPSHILRADPAGGGAVDNTTTAYATATTTRVEFCQACHSLNTGSATHPMEAAVDGSSWSDSTLCVYCHNQNGTPHAGANGGYAMLTAKDDGDGVGTAAVQANLDDVCRRCHLNPSDSAEGVGQTF